MESQHPQGLQEAATIAKSDSSNKALNPGQEQSKPIEELKTSQQQPERTKTEGKSIRQPSNQKSRLTKADYPQLLQEVAAQHLTDVLQMGKGVESLTSREEADLRASRKQEESPNEENDPDIAQRMGMGANEIVEARPQKGQGHLGVQIQSGKVDKESADLRTFSNAQKSHQDLVEKVGPVEILGEKEPDPVPENEPDSVPEIELENQERIEKIKLNLLKIAQIHRRSKETKI
jgi:hypothetical protein